MSTPDLDDILSTLLSIAIDAGQMITAATPSTVSSGTKKNTADLVTETDRAVEAHVSTTLKSKYPNYSFLGEETYQPGMQLGAEPTFIVDPIDGTTNFVHRYPYVSISLGFAVDKKPVVGVVFNPFTGKLYSAVDGRGSYVENVNVQQSQRVRLPLREPEPMTSLSGLLVAVEWGSDRSGSNWQCKVNTWSRLGRSKDEGGAMVHSARCLGSAALNMCAVAEGTIDLYWEGGCWAWDVCAGWVILKEAGGIIVDANPGQWEVPVDHRKYLAVKGGEGQNDIVEEFWSHVEGEMQYES